MFYLFFFFFWRPLTHTLSSAALILLPLFLLFPAQTHHPLPLSSHQTQGCKHWTLIIFRVQCKRQLWGLILKKQREKKLLKALKYKISPFFKVYHSTCHSVSCCCCGFCSFHVQDVTLPWAQGLQGQVQTLLGAWGHHSPALICICFIIFDQTADISLG